MLSVTLRYLPFKSGVLLRQVSKIFKERAWPSAYTAVNFNDLILSAQVLPYRRKRAINKETYAVAPKLLQEMTSVSTVTFTGLNLTRVLRDEDNTLL